MKIFVVAAVLLVVAFAAEYLFHAPAPVIFLAAAAALIPLAGILGRATEELALRTGPAIGGLLNATFGNATELIIALVALHAGHVGIVKASITGSIVGNLLLVLGLAVFVGGVKFKTLKFNPTNARVTTSTMTLAVLALLVPAVFARVPHPDTNVPMSENLLHVSEGVSVILLAIYLLGLFFSLKTHKDAFAPYADQAHRHEEPKWSTGTAVGVMLGATLLVVFASEMLVGSIEELLKTIHLSEIFLGVIVLAVVGNAAEHFVAVTVAARNQMDLSFQIACGSSTQVALFVAPVLVFAGVLMGQPMDLHFSLMEVLAVGASTVVVGLLAGDGEFNWFEGIQLLGVYLILGITFFFY